MYDLEQGMAPVVTPSPEKSEQIINVSPGQSESNGSCSTLRPYQRSEETERGNITVQGVLENYIESLSPIPEVPQIRTAEEKRRYTSKSFHNLPKPLPVLKGLCRPSYYLILQTLFFPLLMLANLFTFSGNILIIHTLVWLVLRTFGIRLYNIRNFWSYELSWAQDLWEDWAHHMLNSNKGVVRLWWSGYRIIARPMDFEQNYLAAFHERSEKSIRIFLGHEEVIMALPADDQDDAAVIETLSTLYHLLKIRRGLSEMLIPKKLVSVEVVHTVPSLGSRIRSLDLGHDRRHADAVPAFHNPGMAVHRKILLQDLSALPSDQGLEFVRTLDHVAITWVVLLPPLASLIFAAIWIGVFVSRDRTEVQEIVTTAFTVATFLVTTGALVIALIAYFEDKVMCSVDEKGCVKRGS